jgi:hypothetical protein
MVVDIGGGGGGGGGGAGAMVVDIGGGGGGGGGGIGQYETETVCVTVAVTVWGAAQVDVVVVGHAAWQLSAVRLMVPHMEPSSGLEYRLTSSPMPFAHS